MLTGSQLRNHARLGEEDRHDQGKGDPLERDVEGKPIGSQDGDSGEGNHRTDRRARPKPLEAVKRRETERDQGNGSEQDLGGAGTDHGDGDEGQAERCAEGEQAVHQGTRERASPRHRDAPRRHREREDQPRPAEAQDCAPERIELVAGDLDPHRVPACEDDEHDEGTERHGVGLPVFVTLFTEPVSALRRSLRSSIGAWPASGDCRRHPRDRPRAAGRQARRVTRAHEADRLPGKPAELPVLPQPAPGRGRPRDGRALRRCHRLLGRVGAREGGHPGRCVPAVLHDAALRRPPIGPRPGLAHRRDEPRRAGRLRGGRLAFARGPSRRGEMDGRRKATGRRNQPNGRGRGASERRHRSRRGVAEGGSNRRRARPAPGSCGDRMRAGPAATQGRQKRASFAKGGKLDLELGHDEPKCGGNRHRPVSHLLPMLTGTSGGQAIAGSTWSIRMRSVCSCIPGVL